MTEASRLDERGRLTIRREYREALGERVVQILTPHGVLLRPVSGRLRSAGPLPAALTATGEEEAEREASGTAGLHPGTKGRRKGVGGA